MHTSTTQSHASALSHQYAGQLRSESDQFILLSTERGIPRAFELAFGAELDPVVQACFRDTQHVGRDRHRLSTSILNTSVYLARFLVSLISFSLN